MISFLTYAENTPVHGKFPVHIYVLHTKQCQLLSICKLNSPKVGQKTVRHGLFEGVM